MDEGDFEWGAALPDLANARNELLVEEIRLLFIHYVIISLFCCTVHCIAILLSLFIQLMFLITSKGHHILFEIELLQNEKSTRCNIILCSDITLIP